MRQREEVQEVLRERFIGCMIRTLARINHYHFLFARSLIFLGQGLSNSMRRIRPKRINYSAQADSGLCQAFYISTRDRIPDA